MGHEQTGAPQGSERYRGYTDEDLVMTFYDEQDPAAGRALTKRLLRHAEVWDDPYVTTFTDHAGQERRVVDYVEYANDHHPIALDGIFDFLGTVPGSEEYQASRATLLDHLGR